VIAVAAFASIATSKPRWRLDAQLPSDTPGKPRLAIVEASIEPYVQLDNGRTLHPVDGPGGGAWKGSARYLIPADRKLSFVQITGTCRNSGCISKGDCEPEGAYVRVAELRPASTWRREVATTPKTEAIGNERTEIPIAASHHVQHELSWQGRHGYVTLERDRRVLVVDWDQLPEGPIQTTWSVKVTMEQPCPSSPTPCESSASSKLELGDPTLVKRSSDY